MTHNPRQLMLTVNSTRAVYDPELIAASGRSMTALGRNLMLTLKTINPTLSLEIPINPTIAKIDSLAEFLYLKVFADNEKNSYPTQLDDYNTHANHKSLIRQLIFLLSTALSRGLWNEAIQKDEFIGQSWPSILDQEENSRLSLITYGDIMQFFDDIDIPAIENELRHYLQRYSDEETFESIIVAEQNNFAKLDPSSYDVPNLLFAEDCCQRFYQLRAKESLVCFLEKQKRNQSTIGVTISPRSMAESCAYKISNMVQLSDRLGKPVVIKSDSKIKQEGLKEAPAIQKDKLALLDRIQPYGYYVEANINCLNEIKLSLNQVIETTSEDGNLEKTTMAIQGSLCQTSDLYGFIFDSLWNNVDQHMIDSQCRSLQGHYATSFESYRIIRADLTDAIKSSIENKSSVLLGLDEVIYHYNAGPNCTCDAAITHRLVINIGLLPYLRCVACEIASSLKCKAIFGNYKISCLLVTGEFLYKWLEQGNSTYGEVIWNHLQKEINAELYKKQLRVHLVMKKSIVLEDNYLNYKPLKREKYRQVFNKQYYLRIVCPRKMTPQIYQDKYDHWIKIPFDTQYNNVMMWQILLLPTDSKGGTDCLLENKFYLILDPESYSDLSCDMDLFALSAADLDDVDTALSSVTNIALMADFHSVNVNDSKARCTFPLEVKITPCSYLSAIDLRLKIGLDVSGNNLSEYYYIASSERLTLEKI